MKRALLLILALTLRSLAADEGASKLIVVEYRVSNGFFDWLNGPNQRSRRLDGGTECGLLITVKMYFPPGASATYIAASNHLIVKQTAPFQKAFDLLIAQWRRNGGKTPPNPKLLEVLREKHDPSTK